MDYTNRTVVRIRVMTMPSEMGFAVLAVVKGLQAGGYEITEISPRDIPNRQGVEVRRYITATKQQGEQT